MRVRHLALLLALLCPLILGAENRRTKPPRTYDRAAQYDRILEPVDMWGVDHGTANELRLVFEDSGGYDPPLWTWGSIARITCRSRQRLIPASQNWPHEVCVACWMQTKTGTISLGPTVTISGVTVYTLGDGAGYIEAPTSGSGIGACVAILAGDTETITLSPNLFHESGDNGATVRNNYCSTPPEMYGRPCRVAADCDTADASFLYAASTCTSGRPDGAFLGFSFTATVANAVVTLMR